MQAWKEKKKSKARNEWCLAIHGKKALECAFSHGVVQEKGIGTKVSVLHGGCMGM